MQANRICRQESEPIEYVGKKVMELLVTWYLSTSVVQLVNFHPGAMISNNGKSVNLLDGYDNVKCEIHNLQSLT